MRTDTIDLITRFLAALDAGDVPAALALLHEDVVHDTSQAGREIGPDKYRWHLAERSRRARESFHDIAIMATDDGTRAAAEFTLKGRGRDGEAYSVNAGMFFSVSDGRIERITPCRFPHTEGPG